MGKYNFDEEIDRKNTDCLKYDFAREYGKREGILPLWVADMDFRTAPEITDALVERARHGIFGYSDMKEDYFEALYHWFLTHFRWEIKKEWLVKTPGVVFAIAAAVRAFTNEGDGVLLCQPVYYPFTDCILDNKRKLVNSQLVYRDGQYVVDYEDFERKIIENHVTLFLLCSPHNPVGRVWTREELTRVGEICLKHKVVVLSDEIHCDFTYEGFVHTPFAAISEEFAKNSVICTAPSKTFNLAGLQVSNIFIADEAKRNLFCKAVDAAGYSQLNVMGLVAAKAAYTYGEEWLCELKAYLAANLSFVREFLKENIPQIKLVEPQGLYLIWLDCSALGLSCEELERLVSEKANLWLDGGIMFGSETGQFQRINIACTRKTLTKALCQLADAVKSI